MGPFPLKTVGMMGLLCIALSCAHTGPPVETEEQRAIAKELAKEAKAYQQEIQKYPEKDIQNFHYNDAWMKKQETRLKKITTRICRANNFEIPELEVHPGEQSQVFGKNLRIVNAATDGSRLLVTAAMMKLFEKNDDELAAVIGHELAHIHRNHISKRLWRNLPVAILIGVIDAQSPAAGDAASTLGSITLAEFDRDEEREADVYGLTYMKNAKFDYHKAPNAWRKMAILYPEGLEREVYFGDSHPFHPERLIRLRKAAKDLDAGQDPIQKYLTD